jgi:hypothetical protein
MASDTTQLDASSAGTRPFPFQFSGMSGLPFDLPNTTNPLKHISKARAGKPRTDPSELDLLGPSGNAAYSDACHNPSLILAPHDLRFLPSAYWANLETTFGDLVGKFFQRKNNANCRFHIKLFNALSLVEQRPDFFDWVGVQWVNDHVFKVDKFIFGRLLGITSVDGGLFHRQGNFPSHGFSEVTPAEIEQLRAQVDLTGVDCDRVRLMLYRGTGFSRNATEDDVIRCKWITEVEPRR